MMRGENTATYDAQPVESRYRVHGNGFIASVVAHGWMIAEAKDRRLAFLVGKPRRALMEYASRKNWRVEMMEAVMA